MVMNSQNRSGCMNRHENELPLIYNLWGHGKESTEILIHSIWLLKKKKQLILLLGQVRIL